MSDLISRQAAIKAIEKNMHPDFVCSLNVYKGHYTAGLQTAVTVVDNLPAAEPERKTGKWLCRNVEPCMAICSRCGRDTGVTFFYAKENWKFCPYCGSYNEEVYEDD